MPDHRSRTAGNPVRDTVYTAGRDNGRRRRPKGYAAWGPRPDTRALIDQVNAVLDEYADHLPLTVRQVFYRLVGAHGYDKTERAYARLGEHLVRARRARLIPFEELRDDGIVVVRERWFDEPADFWDHVGQQARDYRRDKQLGQRAYVELWCESAGMLPQLARAADAYSVPVFSCGGFSSLTAVRSIVERARRRGTATVILHVGDLDPSGEAIFDHIVEDASAFLAEDRVIGTQRIVAERVALTADQVAPHQLPTAPAKPSDSRSTRWTGETCQCEALPPDLLARLVRDAIERHLDVDLVAGHEQLERAERVQLLRALPAGEATP